MKEKLQAESRENPEGGRWGQLGGKRPIIGSSKSEILRIQTRYTGPVQTPLLTSGSAVMMLQKLLLQQPLFRDAPTLYST